MPYRYPPEFRRNVLDPLTAGRSIARNAADLGSELRAVLYEFRRGRCAHQCTGISITKRTTEPGM
jgi:hypothetical protein